MKREKLKRGSKREVRQGFIEEKRKKGCQGQKGESSKKVKVEKQQKKVERVGKK